MPGFYVAPAHFDENEARILTKQLWESPNPMWVALREILSEAGLSRRLSWVVIQVELTFSIWNVDQLLEVDLTPTDHSGTTYFGRIVDRLTVSDDNGVGAEFARATQSFVKERLAE